MNKPNNVEPSPNIRKKIIFGGNLDLESFFRVFRVVNIIKDPRDIAALTLFYGSYLVSWGPGQPVDIQGMRMHDAQAVILWMRGAEDWQTDEDPYLSFSYHLLVKKELTRGEAASFVSEMLGYPIAQDVWRKRVDRWAHLQGFPPVGQTKRRPRA